MDEMILKVGEEIKEDYSSASSVCYDPTPSCLFHETSIIQFFSTMPFLLFCSWALIHNKNIIHDGNSIMTFLLATNIFFLLYYSLKFYGFRLGVPFHSIAISVDAIASFSIALTLIMSIIRLKKDIITIKMEDAVHHIKNYNYVKFGLFFFYLVL